MTKLLLCEDCKGLVVPSRDAPRACRCGRHHVWPTGMNMLMIYDSHSKGKPTVPRAFVVGLHNGLLFAPEETTTQAMAREAVESPEGWPGVLSTLFHRCRSPLVKTRPGSVTNVSWADALPAPIAETTVNSVTK